MSSIQHAYLVSRRGSVRAVHPRVGAAIELPSQPRGGPMRVLPSEPRIRLERGKGPIGRASLPAESQPVVFGVHGAVAKHYKVAPDAYEPHATTLDYVIAAAGG